MAYATKDDMLKRYEEKELIQLTDNVEPYQNVIEETILANALNDASATIDMYLGTRYDLPLGEVPDALIDMCCTVAYYRLSRGRYSDQTRQAFEDALAQLEKIAAGKILLNVGGEEPKSASAIAKVSAPDRIFNRESLKGF